MSKPDITTVVQSSLLSAGYAGQIADGLPAQITSHTNTGATDLEFGAPVARDTNANGSARAWANDTDTILGVSVRNPTFVASSDGNNTVVYKQYHPLSVMIDGDIFVKAVEAVRRDDQVLIVTASPTGFGGSKGGVAGAGRIDYPNAIWLDDTAANGIGRIRVKFTGTRRTTT